ncbi:MAG: hypothetical protein AAF684_09855, partial [Pseudomonadota bacterium]
MSSWKAANGSGLRDFTALLIGAVLGYGGYLAFGAPDGTGTPLKAQLHCAPMATSVGRTVRCLDLSQAPSPGELNGPDGPLPLIDGAASIAFDGPGSQPITLTVRDGPRWDSAMLRIDVAPRQPIDPPLGVALQAPAGLSAEISFDVFESAEPGGPALRSFERRWPAEDGRRIERIRLSDMSTQGLSGLRFRVIEDGRAALLSFSLRPGDRRAWLMARVTLDYSAGDAPGRFGPTTWMDADGLWRLPARPGASFDAVTLLDADGAVVAEAPLGGTTTLRDGTYALSVDAEDGALWLDLRAIAPPAGAAT